MTTRAITTKPISATGTVRSGGVGSGGRSSTTTNQSSKPTNVTSGNQFVAKRDGTVDFAEVPFQEYAKTMGNAFGQTNDAQSKILKEIFDYRQKDPNTQANADATRTTANAAMKQAEAEYLRAQNESSEKPWSPFADHRRKYQDGTFKSGTEQYQDILARRRGREDYVFQSNIDAANQAKRDKAQYDLDTMVARINADRERDVARIDADSRITQTRIQQPLSAGQVLERTRIENPDPVKGMAMNLLGGYSNQGARSNFAYWG
jgi:hypothetical protein